MLVPPLQVYAYWAAHKKGSHPRGNKVEMQTNTNANICRKTNTNKYMFDIGPLIKRGPTRGEIKLKMQTNSNANIYRVTNTNNYMFDIVRLIKMDAKRGETKNANTNK